MPLPQSDEPAAANELVIHPCWTSSSYMGVARIFPAGCTHFLPEILMTFFVITLLHILRVLDYSVRILPPNPLKSVSSKLHPWLAYLSYRHGGACRCQNRKTPILVYYCDENLLLKIEATLAIIT